MKGNATFGAHVAHRIRRTAEAEGENGGFTVQPRFTVEVFEGGTVSGGSPLPQNPRNRATPGTPPYLNVDGGVTIDVGGVSIGKHHFGSQQRDPISADAGGLILKASTTYYITFTNDDSQPAISDIEVISAAVA